MGALVPQTEGAALGKLVPRTEPAAWGGVPLTFIVIYYFRIQEGCISIAGLPASLRNVVARVSFFVVTADGCTGHGPISPAADTAFTSVFGVPTKGGTSIAEGQAAATTVAHPTTVSTLSKGGTGFAAIMDPTVTPSASLCTPTHPSAKPPSDCISARKRRRTATATSIAPPAVHEGFGPGGAR